MIVSLFLVGVECAGPYDHDQVVGMDEIAEICLDVKLTTALA